MRVSSRSHALFVLSVSCLMIACSNIHEYVKSTVKKLLVVNLEPIVAKIRYGFESATVTIPFSRSLHVFHVVM
jgi:hypothetical protein